MPFVLIGQSNYKPGYVVTLKGDTLHGFIDYRGWDANPTEISFKLAIDNRKTQKFTTSDITLFSIENIETYQKYICSISLDETNTTHLISIRDTSFKIDTVFLKILQRGKNLTLYVYTDDLKTRYYISEAADHVPTELIYRIFDDTGLVDRNTGRKEGNTVIENTFLKQLFALANKYNVLDENLSRFFETAKYIQPDLLEIVSKINHISKSEFAKKYQERSKINFFGGVSLNISHTSSNAASTYTASGGGPYTSYLPAVSLGVNFMPKPNSGKVEFRAELLFAETRFNENYVLKISPAIPFNASYNQLSTSFMPQVIFNLYNAEKLKIYFGIGIAATYYSYGKTYFGSQNPNLSDDGLGKDEPWVFNYWDNSFLIKAGAKFNKNWGIFFNYLTSTVSAQGGYFQFDNTNKQIGLVYFFGK